jgi:hypothetical protein
VSDVDMPQPGQPQGADPSIGTRLGRYQITAPLGRGGMGVVYQAEDSLLKRKVAIKLLPPALAQDADSLRRFRHEAQLAARLNHPNVVTIYEVGQQDAACYIAMELVSGGSAQDILHKRGPFKWQHATRVIEAVCRGLVAAHQAELIHRDIKPSNIMRAADGTVKLADFGLAKATDQPGMTTSGFYAGTPHYMSPEQCRQDPVDDLTDIYSLGATYYALLVGRPPYPGEKNMQVMFAHCSSPVPDPREADAAIPEACAAIVRRAMAKLPTERFASAAEMLTALKSLLSPASGGVQPPALDWNGLIDDEGPRPESGVLKRTKSTGGPARYATRAVGLVAAIVLAAWLWTLIPDNPLDVPLAPIEPGNQGGPKASIVPPRPVRDLARSTAATLPTSVPAEGFKVDMSGPVATLAISPNGEWLAAGYGPDDGGLVIWDRTTGKPALELAASDIVPSGGVEPAATDAAVACAAFSPDNSILAIGVERRRGLWLLDRDDTGLGWRLPAERYHAATPTSVSFAPGGPRRPGPFLVAAFTDVPETAERAKVWSISAGIGMQPLLDFSQATWARVVAFRPHSEMTIAFGTRDHGVLLWTDTVRKPRPVQVLTTGCVVNALAFSPDGKWLAVGGPDSLQLWELDPTPRKKQELVLTTTAVAFAPDGTALATAGDPAAPGEIVLRPAAGLTQSTVLKGHTGAVSSLAFSRDGATLVSGGADRTMRLWPMSRP